jgi:hypothetical protein
MKNFLALALVASLALPGCGKKQPPAPVEVKGRVVNFRNEGVPKLILSLNPVDDLNRDAKPLRVVTDETGNFTGQCSPGAYTVSVSRVPEMAPGGMGGAPGGMLPRQAGGPVQLDSQARIVIPPGGHENLEVRVK